MQSCQNFIKHLFEATKPKLLIYNTKSSTNYEATLYFGILQLKVGGYNSNHWNYQFMD